MQVDERGNPDYRADYARCSQALYADGNKVKPGYQPQLYDEVGVRIATHLYFPGRVSDVRGCKLGGHFEVALFGCCGFE